MDCFIISYISSQRKLYLIAILVNNAFKTVQQRVKDKEDICRRADARQRYLTQDFTLRWTGLRCVILEDRYKMYNINIRISDVFIIIISRLTFLLLLLSFISFIHSSILYYMFPGSFSWLLLSLFLHIHFKAVYSPFQTFFLSHGKFFRLYS